MSKPDVAVRGMGPGRAFNVCLSDVLCPHCGYYSDAEGPIANTKCALVVCHRCGEAVMLEAGNISGGGPVTDYYPKRTATVDPFVPKDIADDYLEAQRCFSAGAWHGCAVMARRCMHSVAEHFSASGRDLFEQIENLKASQVITPVLA